MNNLEPINQTKLFGLDVFINELINLYECGKLPGKILLSGPKGMGKSTLAFHFINFVLSKNEDFSYNIKEFKINADNHSFKTVLNKSNPNLILVDVSSEKKSIDINQIRELILNLNKSAFNQKPRFVLIDNIEFLNINSVNALLKVIEEPSDNVHFILINNNKKISSTLLSRCIKFKVFLSNNECLEVTNKLLDEKFYQIINKDLINYYLTPGNIYNLVIFSKVNDYDLKNLNLKNFLKILIKDNHYKKDSLISYLIFDFIEFYLTKIDQTLSSEINNKYSYFLKKISDTKKFNLDEETLFTEFEKKVLNG